MSYLQSFSTVDLSENESYVSESVGYEPKVQVGEEEVKSGVRGNDGKILPDLNQEYVEEQESFFVPPSYPQYMYGTYHSRGSDARKLFPAYTEFYNARRVEMGKNRKYAGVVKYAPEDIGNALSDLFFESGSMSASMSPSLSESRTSLSR